jgi:hypothetical protein
VTDFDSFAAIMRSGRSPRKLGSVGEAAWVSALAFQQPNDAILKHSLKDGRPIQALFAFSRLGTIPATMPILQKG